MKESEQIALIDRLCALPSEVEWLEFKRGRLESQAIGEYLSALANSACVANQPRGYLVVGIDDDTHAIVGTRFDPYATKGKGNQDLLPWLAAGLRPNTGFETRIVEHPDGRVVLFEVGPANEVPVSFCGTPFIRVGSSKTELRKHPEKERAIWTRGSDWSAEVCAAASLEDLDPEAVAKAREQFVVKHPGQAEEVEAWDDRTFLNKARVLKQGAVTHAAILLLGRPESATLLSPAVAKISWILKDAENRELDYEHVGPPFLFAGLVEGRYPNLIVAGAVAKATGEAGRHIRERGFDRQYYLDLILALVREHGSVSRKDVDQVLVPKLPDRLTEEQKLRKVNNLLQELRRAGRIENRGHRAKPEWVLTGPDSGEDAP